MANLFSLFIRPASGDTTFAAWQQVIPFASSLPANLVEGGNRFSAYAHLEADTPANADIFAAVSGKLSTRPPSGFLADTYQLAPAEELNQPQALILYLEPNAVKLDPSYSQALAPFLPASALNPDVLTSPNLGLDALKCFVYINADAQELKQALCPKLKTLAKNKPTNPPPCSEAAWGNFLAGEVALTVRAGDRLGKAGVPYLQTSNANARQLAFGVLAQVGPHDPGFFYEAVTTHLPTADASLASSLARQLLGLHWPAIPANANPASVGTDRTLPYSVLIQYKNDAHLTYTQWRTLGDRQKALYLERLLQRTRPGLVATPNTPRFEFNMDDTYNLFQLEAVVEYFANFPDPWKAGSDPHLPGDPGYRRVNFLPLYGTSASVNASQVTLDLPQNHALCLTGEELQVDPAHSFSLLFPGRDILTLDGDTARPHHAYRILNFDPAAGTLSLDQPPQVGGASPWRISQRPCLVQVDAFGARLRGGRAVKTGLNQVRLENLSAAQLEHLKKVNPTFDTLSLASVVGSTQHEFRIQKVELSPAQNTALLTLNADASPVAAGSSWRIPAGVGGLQPGVKPPKSSANPGLKTWDHYDGMMFIVLNGRIEGVFPWTSFTTRAPVKDNTFSSIRGNRLYHMTSILSRKKGINFSFEVSDEASMAFGRQATKGAAAAGGPFYGATYAEVDISLAQTLARPLKWTEGSVKHKRKQAQWIYFTHPTQLFTRAAFTDLDLSNQRLMVGSRYKTAVPDSPSAYWLDLYDGVHEGGLYFQVPAGSDTAPADQIPPHGPQGLGKGAIRLHVGGTSKSTGSLGCNVSPVFTLARNLLIQHHLDELADFYTDRAEAIEFRNLRTTETAPPLFARYTQLIAQLAEYQAQLKLMQEAFREVLAVLTYNASQEEKLADLQAVLDNAVSAWEQDPSLGDETPSPLLLSYIEDAFELLLDQEVSGLLEQQVDPDVVLGREQVKQMEKEIARLQSEIAAIETLWNDRIQGLYWLIRPDEPPAA